MRRAPRVLLRAGLLLGLSLPLAGLTPSGGDGLEPVRKVLARRGADDARTRAQLVAELAALGARAVPPLYELVSGRGLEVLAGEEWRPGEWLCTPEEVPLLAQESLALAPPAALAEQIGRVLDGQPETPEHLVLLRLLGARARADGLDAVLRSASLLGEMELQRPRVRAAQREALRAILRQDPKAFDALDKRLDGLAATSAEIVLEAIGESARPRGMRTLERFLRRGEPAEELVIEAMARLEESAPWSLAGTTLARVRGWWSSPEGELRARVARLAGSLHAVDSVAALVELVGDAETPVRQRAAAALERMSRVPLGVDQEAWESWHERELAWYEARWDTLLEALAGTEPGPANEALLELVRHPLYRHEAAAAVAARLAELPPPVGVGACAELERLGSRLALPGLAGAVESGRQPQLRAAALRALRALSGEERDPAGVAWRAWLGELGVQ